MDKAQHNERPTDIVLTGTLREEAKRASLRRNFGVKFYLSAIFMANSSSFMPNIAFPSPVATSAIILLSS